MSAFFKRIFSFLGVFLKNVRFRVRFMSAHFSVFMAKKKPPRGGMGTHGVINRHLRGDHAPHCVEKHFLFPLAGFLLLVFASPLLVPAPSFRL